jgi:hypothetical protein
MRTTITMPWLDDAVIAETLAHPTPDMEKNGEVRFCHDGGKAGNTPYLAYKKSDNGAFLLSEAGHCIGGKSEGMFATCDAVGQVISKTNFHMGKKQGLFRYYEGKALERVECWDNNFRDMQLTEKMSARLTRIKRRDRVYTWLGGFGDLLRGGKKVTTPEQHIAWRENEFMAYYIKKTSCETSCRAKKARPIGLDNGPRINHTASTTGGLQPVKVPS